MYITIANKQCGYASFPYNNSLEEGEKRNMIARIWHGWTTPGKADQYESLLKEEIFVGIQNRP